MKRLNVVHICDHLGWEGSRMHGVKRLFAWMIPRFDASRYNVSLISLRRKDLSEDTLEQFGVDGGNGAGGEVILARDARAGHRDLFELLLIGVLRDGWRTDTDGARTQ